MAPVLWRLARRLLTILVVVFFILSIDFVTFRIVPGDPYQTIIPKGASQAAVDEAIDFWKLNEPVIVQYVNFLKHYFTGDFGKSISVLMGMEIQDFIYAAVLRTIGLAVSIATLSILLAVLYERVALARSKYERKSMHFLAMVPMSISVPALGLLLLCFAHRTVPYFPTGGDGVGDLYARDQLDAIDRLVSVLRHAFLPVLAGVLSTFGLFVLMLNGGLRYFVAEKGLRPLNAKDIHRHGYFVAALKTVRPMPTFFVSWVLSLALAIDMIFSYHGLGTFLWYGLNHKDYPVLMAAFFVVSVLGFLMILAFCGFMVLWQESPTTAPAQAIGGNATAPDTRSSHASLLLRLRALWNEYKKSVSGVAALVVFTSLAIVALLAPLLATVPDPYAYDHREPFYMHEWENPLPPSLKRSQYTGYLHPLGTDTNGGDIYSMWLYGARAPLVCAIIIGVVCVLVGYLVGVVASQLADMSESSARLMGTLFGTIGETFLAIPIVVLLASFVLVRQLGPYTSSILFALILFSWAWAVVAAPLRRAAISARSRSENADILRARTDVGERKSDIVKARLLFVTKFAVPMGILTMALLSFYGILDPSDDQSWGMMLGSAYEFAAFTMGGWVWLWIAMPLIGICALALSTFVMLQTLERVYIRRLEPLAK